MFTTVPVITTQTTVTGSLTEKAAAFRALNQLCSLTAGRRHAKATDPLKEDPAARIQKCLELTLVEAQEAASQAVGDPNGDRLLAQANRKMDSFRSLALLARIIQTEVIWDDD